MHVNIDRDSFYYNIYAYSAIQVTWDHEHEDDICDECEIERASYDEPSDWWSCKVCKFQCCRDCADSGCLDDTTGLCLRCEERKGQAVTKSKDKKRKYR